MEEFGYQKRYKLYKILDATTPLIFLIGLAAIWLFLILPSRGDVVEAHFKWWVPIVAIGLIGWAVIKIRRTRGILRYRIRLSEDTIEIGNEVVPLVKISKIECKSALGENPAVLLHIDGGRVLGIPAGVEGLA